MSELFWCNCLKFALWYVDGEFRVCVCGHPSSEHLDDVKSCMGVVELRGHTREGMKDA